MAYSFIAAASGTDDGAGTTLDCSTALSLEAGDLLVVWALGSGGDFDPEVSSVSGSPANSFTFDDVDKIVFQSDLCCSFGYVLWAQGDPAAVFRFTTLSRTFRHIIVMQFRLPPGYTSTKDGSATGSDVSSTAPQSGTITTTENDGVVCGGYGEYAAQTTTDELINGASATEPTGSPAGYASAWYRILTAPFSGGGASATLSAANGWVCNVIAFKSGFTPEANPETLTYIGDLIEYRPHTTPVQG